MPNNGWSTCVTHTVLHSGRSHTHSLLGQYSFCTHLHYTQITAISTYGYHKGTTTESCQGKADTKETSGSYVLISNCTPHSGIHLNQCMRLSSMFQNIRFITIAVWVPNTVEIDVAIDCLFIETLLSSERSVMMYTVSVCWHMYASLWSLKLSVYMLWWLMLSMLCCTYCGYW